MSADHVDLQAEVSLIGSMMLDRSAVVTAIGVVSGTDFYRGAHRTLYECIVDLHTQGTPVDLVTLTDELDRTGQLVNVGGPTTVADIASAVPHAASASHYARIVAEKAQSRRLLDVASLLVTQAANPTQAAADALSALEDTATARQTIRILDGDDVDSLPDPDWLIRDLLPEGLSCVYGPSGAGKSFLVLSWVCAMAANSSWFGRHVSSRPVIYVAAEGAGGLKLRRRAWMRAHPGASLDALSIIPQALDPADPSVRYEVARMCADRGAGLVVWDTVARCMTGDENSTDDMGRFIAGLDQLRDRTGASQLVVHHTKKDGGEPRGNGSLEAACDGMLKVVQAPDRTITLSSRKLKDAPPVSASDYELVAQSPSAVLRPAAITAHVPASATF